MRTIKYTVGKDIILPSTVQFGGFAGEDNVTTLEFRFSDELADVIAGYGVVHYLLEVRDSSGAYDAFPVELTTVDEGQVLTFRVPRDITLLSGKVILQLSIVKLDENSNQERKLFTYPVKLRFAQSTAGGIEGEVERERYHTDVLSAMIRAEQAEEKANEHAAAAANYSEAAENYSGVAVEYAGKAAQSVVEAKAEALRAATSAGEAEQAVVSANTALTKAERASTDAAISAESAEAAAARAEAAIQNVALKKKWSAIDTITLTEAMNAVEVTLPFTENKYTGVIVDIEVASGGTYADPKARINIIPNSQKWGINWPVSILNSTPYVKVYYEFQNGAWQGWSQKETASANSTTHTMNNINTMYFVDGEDWVKEVIVNCNNSSDEFPVGTRIRLWGVK